MKFLFIIFVFCLPHFGNAFQSSSLEITVIDPSSALIQSGTGRLKKNGKLIKEIKISKLGNLTFSNLNVGTYLLEIEAFGFKNYSESIEVRSGIIKQTVKLEVAELVENVVVEQSEQDKDIDPRNGAFTNFLTKAEIEALSDDPEIMKKQLKQKFGDDAEFFVDGFKTDGLPRKTEIASIKVNQNSFDAEYHKIGIAIIEFATKPSTKFFGNLEINLNDFRFNAREPFASVRNPQRELSFFIFLSGPIKSKKSSFSILVGNSNDSKTEVITARQTTGLFNNTTTSQTKNFNFQGRLSHLISQFQSANLIYSINQGKSKNQGIGGFDLPSRSFNLNTLSDQIRYSQVGNVGNKYYNEFRFQFDYQSNQTISANLDRTIIVLDSFVSGSAGNDNKGRTRSFSMTDNFLFGVGKHALKFGVNFDFENRRSTSAENQNGTFIFSNLESFQLNSPTIYSQKLGTRNSNFSKLQFGTFIQNDVRLKKNLLLSLGLRYELQNNLKDYNNFSPRLGFSWSPQENGKTTFRGGLGLFYNWFSSDDLGTILSQDQNQIPETVIINPGFPNPFQGGEIQILPKSFRLIALNLQNPYVFLAQFGVQRQLNEKTSIRVQYTYQKAVHLFRSRDINAPINFIRPNQTLGRILQFVSSAFSLGNQLRANFITAPTENIYLTVNYRLFKGISDSSGSFGLPSDNYNLRADRSFSNNDQRHILGLFLGIGLPKSFKFSAAFQAASPLPYTVTTGIDDNGDSIFNDRPEGFLRNSERGSWHKQFDVTLSWQFSFEKKSKQISNLPGAEITTGKNLILRVETENLFNQTSFVNFGGVQTSTFFRQPVSASNPRKIRLSLKFAF